MVMLPLIIRPMVWSSRALATASAPMLPPAPTLLSTITGCPNALDNGSANVRAVRSGEEPAGNPTMILSGLVGQAKGAVLAEGWACAQGVARVAAAVAAQAISNEARRETGWRDMKTESP